MLYFLVRHHWLGFWSKPSAMVSRWALGSEALWSYSCCAVQMCSYNSRKARKSFLPFMPLWAAMLMQRHDIHASWLTAAVCPISSLEQSDSIPIVFCSFIQFCFVAQVMTKPPKSCVSFWSALAFSCCRPGNSSASWQPDVTYETRGPVKHACRQLLALICLIQFVSRIPRAMFARLAEFFLKMANKGSIVGLAEACIAFFKASKGVLQRKMFLPPKMAKVRLLQTSWPVNVKRVPWSTSIDMNE